MDTRAYPKGTLVTIVALGTALVLSACTGPGANNTEPAPTVTITVAPPEPGPEPTPSGTGTGAPSPSPAPTTPAPTTPPPTASASPSPSVTVTPTETPTATPTETATPTPTATTPATPVVAVTSQQCISSRLTVGLTASYDNSHQKGIQKVVVERPNEYNAWIAANASWLGIYAGQGNQWTVQPAGSKAQRFKDQLRITVTATGGATTVVQTTVSAPC